jgi:hypothetical protein
MAILTHPLSLSYACHSVSITIGEGVVPSRRYTSAQVHAVSVNDMLLNDT